jgi:hypothetical protein
MRRPIENNASPGQAVYEPFSGSGTTIIAAEMTGRVCHAIEIAPAYVDDPTLGRRDRTDRGRSQLDRQKISSPASPPWTTLVFLLYQKGKGTPVQV